MDDSNRYKPVRLHYEKYVPVKCNPDLSPIIFLHGFATTLATWKNVRPKIANGTKRQVYTLDLRNHGRSEWSDDFSIKFLAADLENFIIQEGIKKPILVGHSLGGRVAVQLTLQKPEMVSKVVLEEIRLENATEEEIQKLVGLFKLAKQIPHLPSSLSIDEAQDIIATMAKSLFPEQTFRKNDITFQVLKKDKDGKFCFTFNIDATSKSFKDEANYNINLKECKKFPGPALFVYLAKSGMKVNEDKMIPEFFPRLKFCKFDEGGHTPHIELFEEYVEAVSEFINNA